MSKPRLGSQHVTGRQPGCGALALPVIDSVSWPHVPEALSEGPLSIIRDDQLWVLCMRSAVRLRVTKLEPSIWAGLVHRPQLPTRAMHKGNYPVIQEASSELMDSSVYETQGCAELLSKGVCRTWAEEDMTLTVSFVVWVFRLLSVTTGVEMTLSDISLTLALS